MFFFNEIKSAFIKPAINDRLMEIKEWILNKMITRRIVCD